MCKLQAIAEKCCVDIGCKRPCWESVYRVYINDTSVSDAKRVSNAIVTASMWDENKNNKVRTNIKKLKDWLIDVWGKEDVFIDIEDVTENNARKILEYGIMKKEYHGVYIIVCEKVSNRAFLNKICHKRDLVDNQYVGAKGGIYFWGLKKTNYTENEIKNILSIVEDTDMNLTAIKGFNVVNDLSKKQDKEICATMYSKNVVINSSVNVVYRLSGLNLGDNTWVVPKYDLSEFMENGKSKITAYIHTHVLAGNGQEGARFFSARDFHESYRRLVPIYMKHVDDDNRILKATNLNTMNIEHDIGEYMSHVGGGTLLENSDGCSEREHCVVTREHDFCRTHQRPAGNHCLFGIFKRHGQEVFEINPISGSERKLW